MTKHTLAAHADFADSPMLARIAVPAFLSVFAFALLMAAGGLALTGASDSADAPPTPYSADHARIQGAPAEQPPTF